MQTAERVLDVIQKQGTEGKPLERLYRQLFNRDLYNLAYSRMYDNAGATTRGIDEDTLDGMSKKRIDNIINDLRNETYRWKPVRRTYIPKKKGGKRPLGVPSGTDKLLQATIALLLDAYYEPRFSDLSHGFRPNRGCHTALMQIDHQCQGTSWFIEGDIKGCFDNIDHEILMDILAEDIKDGRFLRLIRNLLKAGYVEDWQWKKTLSGTPQGGIISPLLSNIYMHKLDKWIEDYLLPQWNFGQDKNRGRKRNPLYGTYNNHRRSAKRRGDIEAYKRYGKLMKSIPSVVEDDEYRKLTYIRYADDFLLSFSGNKSEAEEIRERISEFLESELNLQLSMEKTLITHTKTEKAHFLGYELRVRQSDQRRKANGKIWFGIPREVITEHMRKYCKRDKATHRAELLESSDYDIVTTYQAEYRGLVQYYIMAHNMHHLGRLELATKTSMLKTLASKHKSTVTKIAKAYRGIRKIEDKAYKVFEVKVVREGKETLITHFGANPLKRNPTPASIIDATARKFSWRSEMIDRMLKDECEMCGVREPIHVHHVRALKDLDKPGRKAKPDWAKRMSALRRKTLMVCIPCHQAIHAGQHRKEWSS